MMADDKQRNRNEVINREVPADEAIIPVVKEQLVFTSQPTVTGEVKVEKRVRTETVDVPLTTIDTSYRERRHTVNRVIDSIPEVRYEGDRIVIPVVREEEVVTKRLVLVEEIHLTKEQRVTERTTSVSLRSEQVNIAHEERGSDT
ncbi:DUF2382 domain-containing protein [Neolewinella litorea]|uniref:DUF2382 domain-containing protein n=1 Tax=Neolewinella litorea TaxID=2562452 RepID=A0A4S4NNS9_9BACT|nr:DUF2382 domain-containing protein [Neolewinella litorea]THH41669.1 DUF2382 domain-containing protein [Neolewinella litorea]